MRILAIGFLMLISACQSDETVRSYGGADHIWKLIEMDGKPFSSTATITFSEEGKISGKAPCNRYFATMTAPYPWFETGPIATTFMACPDLSDESAYLQALSEMTLSEVSGHVLILSNPESKRQLVFKADVPKHQ